MDSRLNFRSVNWFTGFHETWADTEWQRWVESDSTGMHWLNLCQDILALIPADAPIRWSVADMKCMNSGGQEPIGHHIKHQWDPLKWTDMNITDINMYMKTVLWLSNAIWCLLYWSRLVRVSLFLSVQSTLLIGHLRTNFSEIVIKIFFNCRNCI